MSDVDIFGHCRNCNSYEGLRKLDGGSAGVTYLCRGCFEEIIEPEGRRHE